MDIANLNFSFFEKNLIAYIGNKRRLLPLILAAINQLKKNIYKGRSKKWTFLDLFSGTGSVSRLAKSLDFEVHCNDWEYYSFIINKSFIENKIEIKNSFLKLGGCKRVIDFLNSLSQYDKRNAYISKYYCPKDDSDPDIENERMFYSRKNGILIDNIRFQIEQWYRQKKLSPAECELLLSLLLIQASKRSNTSGVFKGFHKGFGGRKGDALSRILAPVKLEIPTLLLNKKLHKVYQADANDLVKTISKQGQKFDIVYLDPPYNQHQYGANYHLLNTIAKNDKPEVNKSFWINGKKVNKSAIRKDWKKTKSDYCYKEKAKNKFMDLIKNLNSRYILLSYSTDGIIPFEHIINTLKKKGKVGIVTTSYVKFRGGRQSIKTKRKNIEYILMVDCSGVTCDLDITKIYSMVYQNTLVNLTEEIFPLYLPAFGKKIKVANQELIVYLQGINIKLKINNKMNIDDEVFLKFNQLSSNNQLRLLKRLKDIIMVNNDIKLNNILIGLERADIDFDKKHLIKQIFILFNKINPSKEPLLYQNYLTRIVNFEKKTGLLSDLYSKWNEFSHYKNTKIHKYAKIK